MPQFQPDQVNFGDVPGYGIWDVGHHREHLQFVQALATQTPAVLIPDFDLLSVLTAGGARRSQIESHAQAHNLLSNALGITAVDFAGFNFDDANDFNSFLGYHAQTHQQIRQALGLF